MNEHILIPLLYTVFIKGEEYNMLPGSYNICQNSLRSGQNKINIPEDLLLHQQIIFNWNYSLYNTFNLNKHNFSHTSLVCPGVSIKPHGRYVHRFLTDGSVHFWVLRVLAVLTCPLSGQLPSANQYQLSFSQSIFSDDFVVSKRMDTESDRTHDQANAANSAESMSLQNLTLSCDQLKRTGGAQSDGSNKIRVLLTGRLRQLRVAWRLQPPFPTAIQTGDLNLRVQVTTRLHYEGNFSLSRKQELCEFYGFWCNTSGSETDGGVCIYSSMRCDKLPDCWLDNITESPDETSCDPSLVNIPYQTRMLSSSTANASSSTSLSARTHSWTSNLPWLVVGLVPAVLMCALVRICSQRRQLDFADIEAIEEDQNIIYSDSRFPLFDRVRSSTLDPQCLPANLHLRTSSNRNGIRRTQSSCQLQIRTMSSILHCKSNQLKLTKARLTQPSHGENIQMSTFKSNTNALLDDTIVVNPFQTDKNKPHCCNLSIDMKQPSLYNLQAHNGVSAWKSLLSIHKKLRTSNGARCSNISNGLMMMSCWSKLSVSSSGLSSLPNYSDGEDTNRRRNLGHRNSHRCEPTHCISLSSVEMLKPCNVCHQCSSSHTSLNHQQPPVVDKFDEDCLSDVSTRTTNSESLSKHDDASMVYVNDEKNLQVDLPTHESKLLLKTDKRQSIQHLEPLVKK